MNCKQMESRLMDYLDGNLERRAREAVEAHARSCNPCATRIREFTDVFYLLDSWKGITPSPSFDARLEQRLREEAAAPAWWENLFPRLVPQPLGNPVFALALLVVILAGAMVVNYSPTPVRTIARYEQQPPVVASAAAGVDDLALYRNLPVLENLDFLRNFEALQELSTSNSDQ